MKALVIEARGLPAGFLGCYGNEWVGTPCLDRLASEGVVFDAHIAADPDIGATEPTCGQEHVGQQRLVHLRADALTKFGAAALRAWRDVPDGGILWIDGPNLAPPWPLPRDLLDSYVDPPEEPWADPPQGVWPQVDIADLLRLHNTFAAVVTYVDAQLDALLEDVAAHDVVVCVTARCGLPLGEHGLVGAGRAWLHEELVHVPLIMRFPAGRDAGHRIPALTQPADLGPTLVQLLSSQGAAPAAFSQGLLPLLHGEVQATRRHARSVLTVGDSAELALRTLEWALVVPTKVPVGDPPRDPQLYVKPDDRWEVNDVRQQHLDLADELEATVRV